MDEILNKICNLSEGTTITISKSVYSNIWTVKYQVEWESYSYVGEGITPLKALLDLYNELELKGLL